MKKKNKQKIADSKNLKPQAKKLNPFEVHINRKKYDILGMKSKSERGLPGVSRAKSLKKRKGTLLQEYKLKDKNNLFLDRRIGERNRAMTAEDKILARYTAERMKFHSKKSIYNLGDDEELTHRGQTLTEIEKFDNPKSDDEDEDEGDGKLDSDFVGDAHFGGGIFRKVEGESKSRKDLIDQLIAESIKRKAEKQKLRQQTLDLTQKLDSEWKELLPLVTASKRSKSDVELVDKKDDKFATYDIMSKKLKFEARGKPTDRLKSEEEIANEEKEKLEALERERQQRMLGETEAKTLKHRSADDLDDGFDLNDKPDNILTYKNGVLRVEGNENESDLDVGLSESKRNGKSGGVEESDEEDDDEDDDENEDEDQNEEEDKKTTENVSVGDEDSNSDSDDLSDLKESDDDVDDDDSPQQDSVKSKRMSKGEVVEKGNNDLEDEAVQIEASREAVERSKEMEAAQNELPYTFEIPKEYEEFEKLMKNYDCYHQSVIIERMIKCHHPSLNERFKADLDLLYTFMLQHLQDCTSEASSQVNCFKILDKLAPWFFDLTQWNPEHSSSSLLEVIKEKYQDFSKSPKTYPSLDTLIFLKLVSVLFPTSDYRHPVVTPSLVFMQEILFQCRVQSTVDLSRGLFTATLLLEYCALSKKFVPEAVNFLHGVLRLAHPKTSPIPIQPPFDTNCENSLSLVVNDKSSNISCTKLSVRDLVVENSSEEFKMNCIDLALKLLSRFCDFWTDDQPAILIFKPFIKLLDVDHFALGLKRDVEAALEKILKLKEAKLKMLVLEKKKPMPLKLYEPNIEKVYSLKKYRPMGKEKTERAKLLHKYKKEMKGALREIRKDRSFIAKLKYKETIKSDLERQRKVQEILGTAAQQAGELNKIQRKKRK